MRTWRGIILMAAAVCLAAVPVMAQGKAQASFERMKGLAGEWEGTGSEGKPTHVTYRLVSKGSVLEETMNVGSDETMVTIYHLDGNRLMVTHYCAAGNQPRMVATPDAKSPNVVAFQYLDATNLASPEAGHMRNLVLTMVDKDHLTQQWTWHEKGKDDNMDLFKLTRKK